MLMDTTVNVCVKEDGKYSMKDILEMLQTGSI